MFVSMASTVTRRSFLGWLAAIAPAVRMAWLRVPAFVRRRAELDTTIVRSLATAILPSELGTAGARRAADGFITWVREYRAGAEMSHGYGNARIRSTGADPSLRWAPQLDALEADAQKAHARGFSAITDEQRRAIVRAQLTSERGASLGNVVSAQHVAVALLAHFYGSPEATDLCYEARIGRNACRPLSQSPQRPAQIRRAGSSGRLLESAP